MNLTQQLAEALRTMIEAAHDVVDNWECGDLAGAVMTLDYDADRCSTALAAYEASRVETTPAGEHTRGPWIVEPVTLTISAPNPKGAHRPRVPVCYPQDTIHRAENMRRIVACVNACEGLETSELEDMETGYMNTVWGYYA